jgi:fumarate hydratase class II
MLPVAAYNLLQAIELLAASAENFAVQLVRGLKATDHGPNMVERGLMIGTALAPLVGYEAAAAIAKEAAKSGRTIREVAREQTALSEDDLERVLDPVAMTQPGLTGTPAGG